MVALKWSYYLRPLEQGLENKLGIVQPAACHLSVTAHSFVHYLFTHARNIYGVPLGGEHYAKH